MPRTLRWRYFRERVRSSIGDYAGLELQVPRAHGEAMTRLAGIELGGTKVIAVLGQGTTIVERVERPLETPNETLAEFRDLIARWHATAPIDALGIASFGPISLDPARADYGRLLRTPKPGWSGVDIVGGVAFDGPTVLHTDVTAAALAEGRFGAAKACDDFAYMTVGTGIGVGIVANRAPLAGQLHPEAGHIRCARVAGDTFPGTCPFHHDCLEGLASGPAIAARAGRPGAELADDDPVWPFVIDALAQGCATLLLTLSSQRIVLGGGVINRRPWLVEAIARRCAEQLGGYLPFVTDRAPLYPAALGDDAGPTGALILAEGALG